MNKINKAYIPFLLALTLLLGMWLGRLFTSKEPVTMINLPNSMGSHYSKIDQFIDYIQNTYVDSISSDSLSELVIKEVLSELDPHSAYLPKEYFKLANENINGSFEGVGIAFRIEKDTIVVVNTIEGGPSEKVGLSPRDRIIMVNDSIVAGVGVTNSDVMRLLKGKRGTKVKLHIRRRNVTTLIECNIIRDKIPIYTVYAPYMINEKIGYLKITQFGKHTYEEFVGALEKLNSDMKHLIIDLRGNGGGLMYSSLEILDELTSEGQLLLYTDGANKSRKNYYSLRNGRYKNLPITILIDESSASASEILAGAIQDRDRGVIIGRRSFGKGLVQEQIPYSDGSAIRLTVARYYTPSGRCVQKDYRSNSKEEYEKEAYSRYDAGEFFNSDSLPKLDTVKYYTQELNRSVYGGGGVIPDIFVPLDTTGYTIALRKILYSGVVFMFTNTFLDQHRKSIKEHYKTVDEFTRRYDKNKLVKELYRFAKKDTTFRKLSFRPVREKALTILKQRIMLFMVRDLYGDKGFYQVKNRYDNVIKKAVKEINQSFNLSPYKMVYTYRTD